MAKLMTPTLWQSIDWWQKCPHTWKKRAYQSLLDMLNRKWAPTKAIERGIAFEKAICEGENPMEKIAPDVVEKFNKAYTMIHAPGHSFQKKAKKIVELDNKEFCLYGKIDVHFPDMIYDIKTTGNYRGRSSYLSGWQHKIYCWTTRILDFKFLVFEMDELGLLTDVHIIDYHVDDLAALGVEIMDKLKSVLAILRSDERLKRAYLNKFNLYG